MPYIPLKDRERLLETGKPLTPGELNFELTYVLRHYLFTKGESYQTYDEMIGALECAKLELYRRKVADYENKKIEENGDVY